jgi:hypothetical membrane protein
MFWPLMLALAAMRPDYSHLHQAISELGAVGAPRMWVWNIGGYILPGLLLAAFGWGLVRRFEPGSRWRAGLLALAGVGLALAGAVPADMDHRQGLQTVVHLAAGSLLSAIAWATGLILLSILALRTRADIALSCLVALAALVGTFFLYGLWPDTPALVQRISFVVFFGWYLAAALLLALRPLPAPSASAR